MKSCINCIHLKDNKNNDGYNCKYMKELSEGSNLPDEQAKRCKYYKEQIVKWGI